MNKLKNTLYHQEVIPPASAWHKIAEALDESCLSDEFPSTLYEAALVPPAGIWDKIAENLDHSYLSTELTQHLYSAEAVPPTRVWNNIVTALEAGAETRPAPVRFMNRPVFRYLAAAMLIGLAVLGFYQWNNTASGPVAVAGTTDASNTGLAKSPAAALVPLQQDISTSDTANETAADELLTAKKSNSIAARVKASYKAIVSGSGDEPFIAYNEVKHPADRYIMLMTPTGSIIRMSKKWGDMVCCVSGEEQNENCKDQLQKWQEKMADAPVAPSPGNFLDILTLVNSLNEPDEL